MIYQEIVPYLPISSLIFYGCVDEPDTEYSWLFLEDVGGEEFAYSIEEHRKIAARWLGELHGCAARVPATSLLPARGPQHYLDHLRSGRAAIQSNRPGAELTTQDVQV